MTNERKLELLPPPTNGRISWPQAAVSIAGIFASTALCILVPDLREAALVVFGSTVAAGYGAFQGGKR